MSMVRTVHGTNSQWYEKSRHQLIKLRLQVETLITWMPGTGWVDHRGHRVTGSVPVPCHRVPGHI